MMSWEEREQQLGRGRICDAPVGEDKPSESRPYKQYCTTLLTLVKAEATLIGSCVWGDGDGTDSSAVCSLRVDRGDGWSPTGHQEGLGVQFFCFRTFDIVRSTYQGLLNCQEHLNCSSCQYHNFNKDFSSSNLFQEFFQHSEMLLAEKKHTPPKLDG